MPSTRLDGAIEDVLAGDTDAAAERLGDAFSTVCERDAPTLEETDAGHPAACHLHGVASEHAPPELASDD